MREKERKSGSITFPLTLTQQQSRCVMFDTHIHTNSTCVRVRGIGFRCLLLDRKVEFRVVMRFV